MIFCKELNKEFQTKAEMFLELKENRDTIVGLKKAAFKESDGCGLQFRESRETVKGTDTPATQSGDYIYPVINTTRLMDSHNDVHLDGIWDLSLKDQTGKVYYAINHDLKIGSIISYPSEVEPYVKTMNWKDLGMPYEGQTQALIFKSKITDKSNSDFVAAIKDKQPLENSIRMQYVDMDLAMDSQEKGMEEENKNFYKYLPMIANKQDAMDQGYFWAVKTAKISKEGSAVLAGSNHATPILYADPAVAGMQKDEIDPSDDSLNDIEPDDCTDSFDLGKLLKIF